MSDKLDESEEQVQMFRIKRILKQLEAAKGNGTSMISLVIPAKDNLNKINKLLLDEYGKSSNIKSTMNRHSVQDAITSARERLKLYKTNPDNGLVLYCGSIFSEDGKSVKVIKIDFEPYKPMNQFLYTCDNKFHTEPLRDLIEDNDKFGFIIMDGNGVLFGRVQGNARTVLQKMLVDLPKKHGRGGQSALRFARLREEKRHNYLRKVTELAVLHFITNDKVNVNGIVVAGSASFKTEMVQSDLFDPRCKAKVIKIVDVSYGFENGFNQAIELASDALSNVKLIHEKKIVGKFFEEIALDTGKIIFGLNDSMKALEMAAIETFILWENLPYHRFHLRHPQTNEESIKFGPALENAEVKTFKDVSGIELTIIEDVLLSDWILENYKNYGTKLEIITDKSQEGFQFVKGFGGIAPPGILYLIYWYLTKAQVKTVEME
jgi:peptide chain release factor subunit 1